MKTRGVILRLAGLVLLWLLPVTTTVAQPTPDNVQGTWTIYSTSVSNGETVVKHVQIQQYGNKLTGYFEGPDQSGPIQGEIRGNYIRFSTVTKNVLNFGGHVYGDEMSGSYGLHGKHAAWQAVRQTPAAMSVPPPTGAVSESQPVLIPVEATATPVTAAPGESAEQGSAAPAPLSSDQLDALVAPIALYPDSLVAQVLAGAAFPDQLTDAEGWLSANSNLTGASLAQAVNEQSWDPSVKALTQFPSVLQMMSKNLTWTESLGQASVYQEPEVMEAVQDMRAKARAAGALQSNSQITVVQQSPSTIVIQPANPQVVYVPQYNPALVYGAPIVVPYYTPPVSFASAAVTFGSGVSIGAFFGSGAVVAGPVYPWGFRAWNMNWGGGGSTIIYNNNTYINNRTWVNNGGYRPGADTQYGPNGAYHPNGYYGPNGAWHSDGPVNHAGGATGSENHGSYAANGSYHPDAGYQPGADTHYGPNGAYHPNEYYGPHGALHPDAPGTGPDNHPNGGDNGNHGLIGGNGSEQQHTASLGSEQERARAETGKEQDPRANGSHERASERPAERAGAEHAQGHEPAPREHESAPREGEGERRR